MCECLCGVCVYVCVLVWFVFGGVHFVVCEFWGVCVSCVLVRL